MGRKRKPLAVATPILEDEEMCEETQGNNGADTVAQVIDTLECEGMVFSHWRICLYFQ